MKRHFHLFAFHRHPDWHGHCRLLDESYGWMTGLRSVRHSCSRWHFHGPFRHRHTPTGLAERHEAEPFRQGAEPNVRWGWQCLTCDAEQYEDSMTAAVRGAAAHGSRRF